ncbi:Putative membrane protein (CBS-domain) [endosymbiont DhMRE of Dentiscutata heterogama]|uniref:CBS domain-containing protein n=1 Tax=endosymbiont DhMRE of Dentiscutata heterogama TaxID=1609546 RepID=UPI000629DAAF|nr:CBS domain-containing protein [endosymbiont DhMRE of Dentiscutata heterogama]CFW93098.1 Putative membrane protein (CBS-domain) [endosymbiont DhMRE of Dentiscutata heterogama]
MQISDLLSLSLVAVFLLLLGFSFFLNYISALYSDVNLFKIDLVKERKDKRRSKKIIFILKNGNLLFAVICIWQVFLNIFLSEIFMSGIGQQILGSTVVDKYKWLVLALFGLTIALTNEIFARYLANRPGSRKMVFNNFFIDITYALIRLPLNYFLRLIVKPRKRIFVNSEQDVMRFVNNLTLDRVLEKNEAQLVQAAFMFDDLRVSSIATPWEKVVAFNHEMPYPEIQTIHSREFFTRYPVLNQKKEVIGTFNMELFYWKLIKNKEIRWQDYVDKRVIRFSPQDKLDKVLTKLQTTNSRMAVIQEKKKLLGIITLQDVLSALVGKIKDEKEILLLPRR